MKSAGEMNIQQIVTNVLMNIQREFNGWPIEFTRKLEVSARCRAVGGYELDAHNVRCGSAAFLVQCLEKDAVALGVADQAWFDIPQLSDGRKVRYYVHNNMGYGIEHWEAFINVVHTLEKGRSCCLLPADWERQLNG